MTVKFHKKSDDALEAFSSQLTEASKSGHYMLAVWFVDPETGDMKLHRTTWKFPNDPAMLADSIKLLFENLYMEVKMPERKKLPLAPFIIPSDPNQSPVAMQEVTDSDQLPKAMQGMVDPPVLSINNGTVGDMEPESIGVDNPAIETEEIEANE